MEATVAWGNFPCRGFLFEWQLRFSIHEIYRYIEMFSSCRSRSATFSSYKHHNTAKGLLGISPNGYPGFVSSLYAGRTSDKKITKDRGILSLLETGYQVMADRGFDIESDLPSGVTLNILPFLNGKPQLSLEEETSTRKVTSVCDFVSILRGQFQELKTTGSYLRWFPLPWPMILTIYGLYVHIWHSCPH